MPGFPGQCGRRNDEHGALGMRKAVTAHPAAHHLAQHTMMASTHDQQVTRAAGHFDQHRSSLAALHKRRDRWIVKDFSPGCDQRILEPLAGVVSQYLPQVARRLAGVGEITARLHQGKNRYQGGTIGTGQVLRVTQCPEAAR